MIINIFGVGTEICLSTESTELQPIRITNTGGQIAENIIVAITIPAGLEYLSDNPSAGTFDDITNEWEIPSIGVGNDETLDLCFTVTDDTTGPWEITYTVTFDENPDSIPSDDDSERNFEFLPCSEFDNCPNIPKLDADENVTGNWTFDVELLVPDDPYDATTWNCNIEVPTKNAIRDKFESLVAGTVPDGDYTDITVSSSGTVWTIDDGLSATVVGDGSVTNVEFQYINSLTSNAQDQIDLKADDDEVVKLTGNQSISGTKTFLADVIVPDETYDPAWDGSLEVPTKNAVYDALEALAAVVPSLQQVLDSGSTLSSSENIATGANTLTISSATALTNPLAITSTTGTGLTISTTTGIGTTISATGIPISATALGATVVANLVKSTATTNAVLPMLALSAQSNTVGAVGLGGSIDISVESDAGVPTAMRLQAVTTDAVNATYTSRIDLQASNSGSLATKLSIAGSGATTLSTYGSGTHAGTQTKNLQVTSAGLIIESEPVYAPVKVYRGIFAQTGVGALTATQIITNSMGEVPTFNYAGPGSYEITSPGSMFTDNKTFVTVTLNTDADPFSVKANRTAANKVAIQTFDAAGVAAELEGSIQVLIEIFA
jgi:hypothetical protein